MKIKYIFFILVFSFGIAERTSFSLIKNNNQLLQSNEKEKEYIQNKKMDKWLAIDKLQHFTYSCLISLGCQYILVNKYENSESVSLPISSGLSFSAGLLKELNDNRAKNGYFSVKDIVANLGGIFLASIIISQ